MKNGGKQNALGMVMMACCFALVSACGDDGGEGQGERTDERAAIGELCVRNRNIPYSAGDCGRATNQRGADEQLICCAVIKYGEEVCAFGDECYRRSDCEICREACRGGLCSCADEC